MHDFFLWLANSNPASILNIFLNLIQLIATSWAVWIIWYYKKRVNSIVTDGTAWLVKEAVKNNENEHFTRIYQRVDALAASIGKEFLCNPEHLIPHRGIDPSKD